MAGIIVQLIISWLLLWIVEKKHLSVLGLKPNKSRLVNLGVGFIFAASIAGFYQLLTTAFINNNWVFNNKVTGKNILENSRWTLVSVLYEELIFRGALLYIAIKKLGSAKACILSAVAFGIYHWFTFNVLGNPFMMAITFLMTAIVGFSWAFSFTKTKSIYLPIGLHFGWNFISSVVFSNGQVSQGLLVRANENQLQGVLSWLVFLFQVFVLPLITFWYLYNYARKKTGVAKGENG